MSDLLHRLGRASAARARAVVLLWLTVLLLVAGAAATWSRPTTDDFSIPGTESFEALDRLGRSFPGADGTSGQVVLAAPAGNALTEPGLRAAVDATTAALARGPQVAAVADPFESGAVSPDGRVAYATVQYAVPFAELDDAARGAVDAAVAPARAAGLTVELGGEALVPVEEIGLTSEAIGLGVAALVLVVTFGALLAAGLPLLTALIGVGIGVGGITAAGAVVELSSTAPTLAVMIGLAVGVDYALFIVSRHRSQLADGMEVRESIARAVATAGGAVVFAGVTVVVALAGLALVGIPFLTVMGLAAAGTVLVAVLVAVTLLPALLALAGGRLGAGRVRRRPVPVPVRDRTAGAAWVRRVTARPWLTLLAGAAALVAVAVPLTSLQLGLPGSESATTERSDRRAYDLVSQAFGPGANGPLVLLVENGSDTSADTAAATAGAAARVAGRVRELPGVAAVAAPVPSADGRSALVTVVPASGPADEATVDLVDRIRDLAPSAETQDGVRIAVTGTTAVNIDISDTLTQALPVFLLVVVGLAFALLTLVFRSLLVTATAILGFLLTTGATLGAVVAVFQWGWLSEQLGVTQVGPILNFLPVLLVAILFGLAMDYQVFLVSRMREEYVHGAPADRAVHLGFTHGARVVTAAALIMVAVFGGFFVVDDPTIKSIGFALAFGVLVDAFVVRMTLVPAAMALLGRRAWSLPARLDRVLPRLDVEGEGLAGDRRSVDAHPVPVVNVGP